MNRLTVVAFLALAALQAGPANCDVGLAITCVASQVVCSSATGLTDATKPDPDAYYIPVDTSPAIIEAPQPVAYTPEPDPAPVTVAAAAACPPPAPTCAPPLPVYAPTRTVVYERPVPTYHISTHFGYGHYFGGHHYRPRHYSHYGYRHHRGYRHGGHHNSHFGLGLHFRF